MKSLKLKIQHALSILLILFSLSCNKDNPVDGSGIDIGIVPAPAYDSPAWHPSGQIIGFNHTPLGESRWGEQHFDWYSRGFWLINTDGTNMRRILPYTLQSPAWSPDGQWIAFVSGAQIFKMRFTGSMFDTTTITQLTFEGRNFFPSWSPDGQWIAYDRSLPDKGGPAGIWRMKFDGSLKHALFGGSFPAWDPRGNILLGVIGISSLTAGTRFIEYNLTQSEVVDTLLAMGNDNRMPRYSPDGIYIAFYSSGNLWLMDSVGNNKQQLTISGVDVSFGLPFSWSPDGSKIIYTRYQSNDWTMKNGVLWMVDMNNKTETQFTYNP
ncbi:MAG: DPP IV N-terminal domain-containing protein [Bacteroidetes bacterium]|nr:DPP IV N-terminal domain-containing protein [Bacteroidota bacterium]